jgi:hypothetical protein
MANISKWFGYPIYITKLENFEEINTRQLFLSSLNDITPTNSQFSTDDGCKTKRITIY